MGTLTIKIGRFDQAKREFPLLILETQMTLDVSLPALALMVGHGGDVKAYEGKKYTLPYRNRPEDSFEDPLRAMPTNFAKEAHPGYGDAW